MKYHWYISMRQKTSFLTFVRTSTIKRNWITFLTFLLKQNRIFCYRKAFNPSSFIYVWGLSDLHEFPWSERIDFNYYLVSLKILFSIIFFSVPILLDILYLIIIRLTVFKIIIEYSRSNDFEHHKILTTSCEDMTSIKWIFCPEHLLHQSGLTYFLHVNLILLSPDI